LKTYSATHDFFHSTQGVAEQERDKNDKPVAKCHVRLYENFGHMVFVFSDGTTGVEGPGIHDLATQLATWALRKWRVEPDSMVFIFDDPWEGENRFHLVTFLFDAECQDFTRPVAYPLTPQEVKEMTKEPSGILTTNQRVGVC